MKVYSSFDINVQGHITSDITIDNPASGFSLMFGYSGDGSNFVTGFGFSGYSGYLFDNSGTFFGGYQSGIEFQIDSHIFRNENRVSYFYNGSLIRNNIYYSSSLLKINAVEFDKIADSVASIIVYDGDKESYNVLLDSSGIFLYSSDNLLLKAF